MSHHTRPVRFRGSLLARRLRRDTRGVVAVFVALALTPILILSGLAVDFAQLYTARTRLGHAIEAAGLAVGSTQDGSVELQDRLEAFFAANYPSEALGTPYGLSMQPVNNVFTVTASVDVPTTFLRVAGYERLTATVSTEIVRETKGLEVVLVLDNTGSMAGSNKIGSLRNAAKELVRILFGSEEFPELLRVALVPYVTTVNIGTNNADLVIGDDTFDFEGAGWKGCVMARPYPHDVRDTSVTEGGPWMAYLWPPEPENCPGHSRTIDEVPRATSGPNKSCARPILPLTNDRNRLVSEIEAMEPWNNGGTMTSVGLAWGLRVVSPEAPFTDALPYDTEDWNKAIVVLTDGHNQLWREGRNRERSNSVSSAEPYCLENGGPATNFNAYGYPLSSGRLGTVEVVREDLVDQIEARYSAAESELNARTAEVCNNIKSNGIYLYTITFKVRNKKMRNLFRDCASDEAKHFDSPTDEDLEDAFVAIATQLSELRVAR